MKQQYQAVFEGIPLGVIIQDENGAIVSANPAAEKILGVSIEHLRGRTSHDPLWQAIHEDGSDFPSHEHPAVITAKTGQPVQNVEMGLFDPTTNAYKWLNVSSSSLPGSSNQPLYPVMTTFEDIGERKSASRLIGQLSRLYATISQVNQAIVRAKQRDELFDIVCQIAVDYGKFKMAWIGLYDPESGAITPTSISVVPGEHQPQPPSLINVHQEPYQSTMFGAAVKTGKVATQIDLLHNTRMKYVHEVAQKFGYQSAASVPLKLHEQVIGLLNIAANEVDFFNSESEINLLEEIGLDISFALEMIEANSKLEAAYRQTSEVLESISDAFYSLDCEERFTYVNRRAMQLWNKEPDELLGRPITEVFPTAYQTETYQRIRHAMAEKKADHLESYSKFLDQWVDVHIYPTEKGVSVYFQDISARKHTELALKQSEASYRLLAENVSDVIWVLDLETSRFTYVSPSVTKLRGYTVEEVLTQDITSSISPASALYLSQVLPNRLERYTQGLAQTYVDEIEQSCKDGRTVFTETSTRFVFNTLTNKLEVFGVSRDITERKQTEEALKNSEQTLRLFVEYAPAAIAMLDLNMHYLATSRRYLIDYNLGSQDIVGKSHYEIFPDIPDRWKDIHRRCLAGAVEKADEDPFMRADGSLDWVRWEIRPWYQQPGEIGGILLFSEVITYQKRAADRLAETQELLQMMYNLGPVAKILLRYPEQIIIEASASIENIFGYTRQELVGQSSAQLDIWVHRGALHIAMEITQQQGHLRDFEFQYKTKTGAVGWAIANAQKIEQQGQTHFLLEFLDISERKAAEEEIRRLNAGLERRVIERTSELSLSNAELVKANRSRDEFLSMMSHELRTPLNAILSLSESLQEGIYGEVSPKQNERLNIIHESGSHLLEMINDILDLSKVEAGRMELRPEPIKVDELCQSALRMIKQQAFKKHLRVSETLDSDAGTIAADGRKLKQMLVNLLSNAVKYTPEGGQVGLEVTREQSGEALRFTVWDTGIGIPPEKIGLLFKPFVQLDAALNREYTGTGLGLALVQRYSEAMGGSAGVESTPGNGSRFWFVLPVIQVFDETSQPNIESTPEPESLEAPRKALVIEDSDVASEQISLFLKDLNTSVEIASNGKDAVQKALDLKPDIILLDILLPDMSGWQVLYLLKENPNTRDIPVVIISVVDEPVRGRNLGASEYLVKPITRERLYTAIGNAISPRQQANTVLFVRSEPTNHLEPQPESKPGLILIAEDNTVNMESTRDYLLNKGFHVLAAANGYEAIERAEEFHPDLILMDIQMPALDGLEAIRRLRAKPAFAATPIIAVTALAMPSDRERCIAAGANEYLAKPVNLKNLLALINAMFKVTRQK